MLFLSDIKQITNLLVQKIIIYSCYGRIYFGAPLSYLNWYCKRHYLKFQMAKKNNKILLIFSNFTSQPSFLTSYHQSLILKRTKVFFLSSSAHLFTTPTVVHNPIHNQSTKYSQLIFEYRESYINRYVVRNIPFQ